MLDFFQSFRGRVSATAVPTETSGDPTRTLDALLRAAVAEGASDVHCEPKEDGLLIRFRLDGEMHDHTRLPLAHRDAFLARGKIFGGMDITEKRLPQDGRAVLRDGGNRYHLRLSTLPTVHGESLVFRLLDQSMPAQGLTTRVPPDQAARSTGAHGRPVIYSPGRRARKDDDTSFRATRSIIAGASSTAGRPVEYEFTLGRRRFAKNRPDVRPRCGLLRQNPDVARRKRGRRPRNSRARAAHPCLTLHERRLAIPRCATGVRRFGARLVAAHVRGSVRVQGPHQSRGSPQHSQRLSRVAAARHRGTATARSQVIPAEKFLPLIAANAPLTELVALREREAHPTLWQRGLAAAVAGETTVEEVARVL